MNSDCINCLHCVGGTQCEIARKICKPYPSTDQEVISLCRKCGWRTPAFEVKVVRNHSATTGEWAVWLERNT